MTTFLFTATPLYGHIDWGGYLPTTTELARRGHKVVWAMEEGTVAQAIRAGGVEVAPVKTLGWHWDMSDEPHSYLAEDWAAYRLKNNFNTWFPAEKVAEATQTLLDLAAHCKADALVSDPFIAAPALASEAARLPYAIVGAPAVSPVERVWRPAEAAAMQEGLARLDWLCATFNVTGAHFIQRSSGLWPHSPDLHLSYFSPAWHAQADEPALPQNKFAGGSFSGPASAFPPDWLPPSAPAILITLGSTFNQQPDFFQTAVKAVLSLGAFPVVATFDADLATVLADFFPPELASIHTTLPYAKIFPHLRGIVHHGGPGTTHAAILHTLPQVIVEPGYEWKTEAQAVERAGVGHSLHLEEVTLENLRGLIAHVCTDSAIKTRARQLQAEFAALPGISGAADWLEALAEGRL